MLIEVSKRKKGRVPPFTTLRCPMVGLQVSWCRFLCKPIEGRGLCGRRAPHGLISRHREAIRNYKKNMENSSREH